MKFVIVCKRQFWGGTIIAHYLCQLLTERGYEAKMFRVPGAWRSEINESRWLFPLYCLYQELIDVKGNIQTRLFPDSKYGKRHYTGYVHLPVPGTRRLLYPRVDDETIVVYMDVTKGNPLHAKNVVRWMCYYNRFPNDDTWYSPTDLFFDYRSQFNDPKLNPEGRILHIFHFDKDLYKRTNFGERKGNCYVIRKGAGRADLPTSFDGPIIDDLRETEKVEILNQCERCYLYDTQTFYSSIAALCGCIPIVVLEPGKTKKDYVKPEDKVYGVAYGDTEKEILYAIKTRGDVMKRIDGMLSANEPSVTSFIETCKDYFHLI